MFRISDTVVPYALATLVLAVATYTQASEPDERHAEARPEAHITENVANGTDNLAPITAGGNDEPDTIEEIVVTNRQTLSTKPKRDTAAVCVVKRPSQIKWRFLPLYDPQTMANELDSSIHIYNDNRRVGDIQLFRLSFGRSQHARASPKDRNKLDTEQNRAC